MALLLVWLTAQGDAAHAFPPERRRDFDDRAPNEYLILPAVASIPGIGVFVGIISSGSNLLDTGIDVGVTLAESIDDSDIEIQALALREVPTGIPHLTFDYWYAHLVLGNLEVFVPGRNSPNFTIPVTAEFDFQLIQPTLRLFERRFTLFYQLRFFDGFDFDQDGNEIPFSQHSATVGMLLDGTDDVVDPREGLRIVYNTTVKAPNSTLFGRDSDSQGALASDENIRLRQAGATYYFPVSDQLILAWDNRFFWADGAIDSVDVVAGGSPPLRGYPANRWSDRYGIFMALEARYTLAIGKKLDFLLVNGVLEGLQFAGFYELGQVSPINDSTLFQELHQSYGGGVRAMFEAIVLRFDLAASNEGVQPHLTIGHAF